MIKVGDKVITFGHFADNSFYTHIDCSEFEPNAPITWLYDSDEEILQLWFVVQHFRDHEGYRRTLSIPFLCHSRQDRVVNDDDVFTLKYFSQIINALHFDRIETFDVHSNVSKALFNHIHVQSPAPLVHNLIDSDPNMILAFPDEGAMARYRGEFPIPTVYGIKERDWETQKVRKLILGGAKHDVAGKTVLIVDDIIGKGHTIYEMSKLLKDMGANKIYVYASHCENTVTGPHINGQSLLEIPNLVEKIYTTNSLWRGEHPKIDVIKEF